MVGRTSVFDFEQDNQDRIDQHYESGPEVDLESLASGR